MHVRVASADQRRGLNPALYRILAAGLLAAAAALAGCRPGGITDDWGLSLDVNPPAPAIDRPAQVEIVLTDGAERPWPGATLQIEAHMEHPGMAPIIVPASEGGRGVYAGDIRFTMAGSWVVYVTGQLPDGRRIRSRMGAPVTVSAEGG